jgi:hypothetical protein
MSSTRSPATRWLDLVKRDPVPWLLDPANPSARLLTLRYLFKRSETALQDENVRLLAWSPIVILREHWNHVNFWGREHDPYFGGVLGNFGTLYLLMQLGMSRIPEVEPACENLLNQGRDEGGRFSTGSTPVGSDVPWLCYTGMALQIMWRFGYDNDLRTRSALAALLHTVLLRPERLNCPIASGVCTHGLVKALAALVDIPAEERGADEGTAIEALGESLINYPFDFSGRDADWLQPTFPRYYRSDIVELCRVVAQTDYRTHPRFQGWLYLLLSLKTDEGRWNKARPSPALSEERLHHPSRWLTFEAVHALTLVYGDTVYAP